MSSELWARIREARKFSAVRQEDLAQACGVTRSAVAQWEYEDPARRTTPSIEQMKAAAKRTGVPLDWLLSDTSALPDLYQYKSSPSAPPPDSSTLLNQAVQYEVVAERPDLAPGFSRSVGLSPFAVRPDFLWDKIAIEIKATLDVASPAKLLLTEQAAGRKLHKVLILVDRAGLVPEQQIAAMQQTFGVQIARATSAADAAQQIITLCK